jgi:hypothetical protein
LQAIPEDQNREFNSGNRELNPSNRDIRELVHHGRQFQQLPRHRNQRSRRFRGSPSSRCASLRNDSIRAFVAPEAQQKNPALAAARPYLGLNLGEIKVPAIHPPAATSFAVSPIARNEPK